MVWIPKNTGIPEINLNPPVILPLFRLFAMIDPQVGQSVWLFVSAAIYLSGVWLLYRQGIAGVKVVWLLTVPFVFSGLGVGQIYVLQFALGVGIWFAVRSDREMWAALLLGILVAMKPNFAIWGFVAFFAGHHRPALVAGAIALALSLVPAVLYGPHIYWEWKAAVALDRHNLLPNDVSFHGFFYRFGIPGASIVVAAVLFWVLAWAYRFKPSLHDLTPVALISAVLCSPLAWIDYTVVVFPFVVDERWRKPMLVAVILTYGVVIAAQAVGTNSVLLFLASAACVAPVLLMLVHFVGSAGNRGIISPFWPTTMPARKLSGNSTAKKQFQDTDAE
jgi:hypothetical protein